MEIYQLRYFLAVAETGNFTKAATRSFVSQPSLSQQVINLENELGVKLFNRLGRKAILTESGHRLVERAQRIVTEADSAIRELKEDSDLTVAVGAIPTVAHFLLHAIVAYCRANEISINLHSREDFRSSLKSILLDGELDWAVVSLPFEHPRVEITPLFSEPLLIALSRSHPLAGAARISLTDLREENFILAGGASSLTGLLMTRLSGEEHFTPTITHRCAQLATVKSLTALGLGISILPKSARSANDPEGLVYRRIEGPPLTRDIVLVRHRRRHLSKGAKLFADAARAVVGPLPSSPSGTLGSNTRQST